MATIAQGQDITERKRIEVALAAERRNLQMIFDVANVGMLLINEHGVVKRINNVASHWTGKDGSAVGNAQPGDILGCIHALNDPAGCGQTPHCDKCFIRSTFEPVLRSGEPVHGIEAEAALWVDGAQVRLWLDVSADPILIDEKKHVILTINNITERKRIEEALKESEERYALAQRAAGIGTWDWDIRAGEMKWSEEVAKLFGISLDRFGGTIEAFMGLVHPDDRYPIQAAIEACIEEGNEYNASHRIVLSDGSVRWIWEIGNVIRDQKNMAVRMLGVVVDITDVRRANEERARLAEIVGASWDAIVGFTPDGVVTSWNPGAERMFGYSEKEMIGRPFSLIVPQDQAEEFSEILERMKKGKKIGYMETARKTKSGKVINVSLSLFPITDASGRRSPCQASKGTSPTGNRWRKR